MSPSQDNIQLAHAVAEAIGINPQVYAYHDKNNENTLHILSCQDPLDAQSKIFCTIGLSDYPNEIELNDGAIRQVPVELLIAGNNSNKQWAQLLSNAGFLFIKNKWACQPGTIFSNIVHESYATNLKHLLFVAPLMWQEKLDAMKISSKKVAFLLLIPISDAEYAYRKKKGFDALETLFMQHEIDITDLNRASVV